MRTSTIACASVVGIVGALLSEGAMAQAIKYVDKQGVVHYVGSEGQIPSEYREAGRPVVLADADLSASEGSGGGRAWVVWLSRHSGARLNPNVQVTDADTTQVAAVIRSQDRLAWMRVGGQPSGMSRSECLRFRQALRDKSMESLRETTPSDEVRPLSDGMVIVQRREVVTGAQIVRYACYPEGQQP